MSDAQPPMARPTRTSTVDDVADLPAFDEEERPARVLTGRIGWGVAIVAFGVAVIVLAQVFRPLPQGSQYYLIIFLAGTLPLVFLAYRSGVPVPARWRRAARERTAVLDWALAVPAGGVCL